MRNPGNVGEISLKNNSTIYLVTDNDRYIHLEGKSPDLCVLDEAQYQDLEYFGRIRQTMMRTKGKIKIFGIGGEAGSHYEKLWKSTNQMEWIYDDPNWREKLRFGYAELNEDEGEYFFEGTQLIIGNYLNTVLKGRWVRPDGVEDNEFFHGYHIPQTISPIIPLTEDDAITKYKTHPSFSIEHQKKNQPMSEFLSHSMGTFYNSEYRSITAEMINLCTEPYRNKSLLTPDDVIHLKKTFGEEIVIGMGVDFGSGGASSTVIAILIWWRRSDRIQLAYIKKRERENQAGQAEEILSLFKKYHCDIGVGDLGYAPNQVKLIQDGGYGINGGESYEGVGKNNFIGCRSISDVTKPFQIFDDTIDEHGEQTGRVQIDKTWGVDQFIELVSRSVMLEDKKCSKLIIPYKNDYEVSFLLEDMYKISRKDLKDIEDKIDTRQHPRKEYNHPPDSVMAVIYGMISFKVKKGSEWFYVSG